MNYSDETGVSVARWFTRRPVADPGCSLPPGRSSYTTRWPLNGKPAVLPSRSTWGQQHGQHGDGDGRAQGLQGIFADVSGLTLLEAESAYHRP